jgi:Peptidase family C25
VAFCVDCGTNLGEAPKFCTQCGARQQTAAVSPPALNSVKSADTARPPPSLGRTAGVKLGTRSSSVITPARKSLDAVRQTLFVVGPQGQRALEQALGRHGGQPAEVWVAVQPHLVQEGVRTALRQLKQRRAVKYVCIVGGWDVVPPYEFENPSYGVGGDDDEWCYCDAPYGHAEDFDPDELDSVFAEFPVGRIPSEEADVLERVLLTAPLAQDARKALAFAVSAEVWAGATTAVVEEFMGGRSSSHLVSKPERLSPLKPAHVLASPGWEEPHLSSLVTDRGLSPGAFMLFNVHGAGFMTSWVGEGSTKRSHPVVFSPATIQDFNGAVLVTEACYGGKIDYDEPSIAQSLFARGGKAFVGCSMVAWGAADIPGDADLIALGFLNSVQQGQDFGRAMIDARRQVVERMDADAPETSEKTILSFNFYGAPWDSLAGGLGVGSSLLGSGGSLLDRTRASMASGSARRPLPLLEEIRERYMSRLGDRGRRFLLQREEARAQFEKFPDAERIEQELQRHGLQLDDCRMESVQRQRGSSFQISGVAQGSGPVSMGVLVVVDAQGKYVSTKTTKTTKTTMKLMPSEPPSQVEETAEASSAEVLGDDPVDPSSSNPLT